METLSIIAYKQPSTKMEIEKIRGVKSDHAVNRLIEYNLVYEVGRLDAPGRPALFATREEFLRRFGVGSTQDLPDLNPEQAGEIVQPPFRLNTRNRTLEKNGERVKLTQVEYAIMKMFMENPGKALSREEILDTVWGRDYFGELKIVDVNIRRLRLKIEDNAQNPTYITTVWGYGYKWGF